MTLVSRLFALTLLACGLASPAAAQISVPSPAGVQVPHVAILCSNGTTATPCNFGSGGSGSSGSGAITAAQGSFAAGAMVDGANVSLGTKADAPWAGSGAATEIAIEKASSQFLSTLAGAVRTNDASTSNRAQTHDDTLAGAVRTNDAATGRIQSHDDTLAGVVRTNDAGTTRNQTHDDGVAGVARPNDAATTDRFQTHDDTLAGVVRTNDAATTRGQTHDDSLAAVVRLNDTSSTLRDQVHDDTISKMLAPVAPGAATATGSVLLGCQFNTTPPTFTTGQQGAVACDSSGRLWASVTGGNVALSVTSSTVGASEYSVLNTASSAMAASIKSSNGQVYGWDVCNNTSAAAYFRLFAQAAAPTVGTSTPSIRKLIAAGACATYSTDVGLAFSNGIGVDVTTGSLADSDSTTIATANQVSVTVYYK